MLDLVKHPVRIEHVSTHTEGSGEESLTFLDIKVKTDVPNTALDRFSPTLRETLFCAGDEPDMHGLLRHVKHPELGLFHWTGSYAPVAVRLHMRERPDITLKGARLGKIGFGVQEGGTCSFVYRLQVEVQPKGTEASRLLVLLHRTVDMTQETSEAENIDGRDEDDD